MAKKNKKDINKMRTKAAQKHQAKRKEKVVALRRQENVQVRYRPGIAEMGAPPGFRAISMTQAMLEYGKPLMDLLPNDMNAGMQATMLLWNHAVRGGRGNASESEKTEIASALGKALGLTMPEAEAFRKRMVDRYCFLFPEDNQPKDRMTTFMFIRKEQTVLIKSFPYERLIASKADIPAASDDKALIANIEELDRFILQGTDYGSFEKLLLEIKDEADSRFGGWLADKGFPEEFYRLASCVPIYLDFVYGYMHEDVVTLRTISEDYLEEFFEDFLLRKMYAEPQAYVDWPPAIKFFYQFLKEKGYLEDHAGPVRSINELEPEFLDVLQRQFG